MTTYYVGPGGNDGWAGTTWATRKVSLQGVEDLVLSPADVVYVGAGSYREPLLLKASGSSGSPIQFIADTLGTYTDSDGGQVRITGSESDISVDYDHNIYDDGTARIWRTFRGFNLDLAGLANVDLTDPAGLILEDCKFWGGLSGTADGVLITSSAANGVDSITLRRCFFSVPRYAVAFSRAATTEEATGTVINDCEFLAGGGSSIGIATDRVYAITAKNCTFSGLSVGAQATNLSGVEYLNVYNSLLHGLGTGFIGAQVVEDYNNIFDCTTPRSSTPTGSNSTANATGQLPLLAIPAILVPWFYGELAPWSPHIRKTGTGATSADMFGLARPTVAAKKSWGALQYNRPAVDKDTTYIGSGNSFKLDDAKRHCFNVAVSAVSTTIQIRVYRETDYAGTAPQMIIKQPGQTNIVKTDASAADQWNQLTHSYTPASWPPFVQIELVSNNTAISGDYGVYFDDFEATV